MILITGAAGFIGSALVDGLKGRYSIVVTDKYPVLPDISVTAVTGDITDVNFVSKVFSIYPIQYVIHLAAEKSLLTCEENYKLARKINIDTTIHLLNCAKNNNAFFIYMSSDQVFDGEQGGYYEDAPINPINNYGRLKAEAEKYILEREGTAVCRTALVFGAIPQNQIPLFRSCCTNKALKVQSFIVQHVLERLSRQNKIFLPADEYMSPTHTSLLTRQIQVILEKRLEGIFHCCGSDRLSRYQFGKRIADIKGVDSKWIDGRSSSSMIRPKDVSLNVNYTEQKLGFKFGDLDKMISSTIKTF